MEAGFLDLNNFFGQRQLLALWSDGRKALGDRFVSERNRAIFSFSLRYLQDYCLLKSRDFATMAT